MPSGLRTALVVIFLPPLIPPLPPVSTETVEKEDVSTVTTETKEDGVVVETTTNTDSSKTETVETEEGTETTTVTSKTETKLADGTKATTNVDADGTVTAEVEIPAEVAQAGETVTLPVANLPDGATVKIADNSKDFTDVKDSDWHGDAVDFVSSRDLLQVSLTNLKGDCGRIFGRKG